MSGDTSTFRLIRDLELICTRAWQFEWRKASLTEVLPLAKVKMFGGVLGGAIRERVAPGKRAERGHRAKVETRVIHAAFMQACSFSASQGSQSGKMQETGRIDSRRVWRSRLDSEPRLQTSTLCMHQTNSKRARGTSPVQDGTVDAAPQAKTKIAWRGSCPSLAPCYPPHILEPPKRPPQGFSTPEPILTRLTGGSESDGTPSWH